MLLNIVQDTGMKYEKSCQTTHSFERNAFLTRECCSFPESRHCKDWSKLLMLHQMNLPEICCQRVFILKSEISNHFGSFFFPKHFVLDPKIFLLILISSEADISFWRVLLEGPPGSPFVGGFFALDVVIPPL